MFSICYSTKVNKNYIFCYLSTKKFIWIHLRCDNIRHFGFLVIVTLLVLFNITHTMIEASRQNIIYSIRLLINQYNNNNNKWIWRCGIIFFNQNYALWKTTVILPSHSFFQNVVSNFYIYYYLSHLILRSYTLTILLLSIYNFIWSLQIHLNELIWILNLRVLFYIWIIFICEEYFEHIQQGNKYYKIHIYIYSMCTCSIFRMTDIPYGKIYMSNKNKLFFFTFLLYEKINEFMIFQFNTDKCIIVVVFTLIFIKMLCKVNNSNEILLKSRIFYSSNSSQLIITSCFQISSGVCCCS